MPAVSTWNSNHDNEAETMKQANLGAYAQSNPMYSALAKAFLPLAAAAAFALSPNNAQAQQPCTFSNYNLNPQQRAQVVDVVNQSLKPHYWFDSRIGQLEKSLKAGDICSNGGYDNTLSALRSEYRGILDSNNGQSISLDANFKAAGLEQAANGEYLTTAGRVLLIGATLAIGGIIANSMKSGAAATATVVKSPGTL